MNTFIIMWNPANPETSYATFKEWFFEPLEACIQVEVTDWRRARAGDRFFMVRAGEKGCGSKGNGIVMSGYFVSDAFPANCLIFEGKTRHCVDVQPDYMFDTKRVETLSDDFLAEHLPEFDWKHGPSGKVLNKVVAAKLEEFWAQCLQSNAALLQDGRKWRTAQDVFKREPCIVLYNHHGDEGYISVNAVFYGGGLDVTYSDVHFDGSKFDEPLRIPGDEPITSMKFYSIEITSLRKAFGVEDNRGVAERLREKYTGINGMKMLFDFAQKAGCRIAEIEALYE